MVKNYIKSNLSKFVVGGLLVMVFSVILGPAIYASFSTFNPWWSDFGYGYGYGYGGSQRSGLFFGYGYPFGYGDKFVNYNDYGFADTDGAGTIVSATAGQTSLTVNYTTNYLAHDSIEYGTSNSFGSTTTTTDFESGLNSATISNLSCGTTYYFRLDSTDAGGNIWSTATQTITTGACSSAGPGIIPIIPGLSLNTSGSHGSSSHGDTNIHKFIKDLEKGMNDPDVALLQIFLNSHNAKVASKGAGSPGNEVTHFGPATKKALSKYQKENAIKPTNGYFGPKTRAFVNSQLGN